MSGHLTIEECIYLVKEYYLNEKSDIHLRMKWPNDLSNSKPPIDKTI
jgi:biotin-(acetyl-CoA carboxylase) ligase